MIRRATVAAVCIAAVAAAFLVFRERRDPWKTLIAATSRVPSPVGRARLSGFDAAPPPVIRAATLAPTIDLQVQSAAFAVLASDSNAHRKAVAAFLAGRHDEAEEQLAALAGKDASIWNDLAVVRATRGTADDDSLVAALAAADRSIDLDASKVAPRFNRALILDKLGLQVLAAKAFSDYLRLDGNSAWAAAARDRVRELEVQRANGFRWRDLAPDDVRQVRNAATEFPQEARLAVEREILPAWGAAVMRGDAQTNHTLLALARTIGETLRQRNGESMAADAVGAIDRAAGDVQQTTVLAAAHIAFGEAIAFNQARQITAAFPKFDEARSLFERGGSPLAYIARHYAITALVERGQRSTALRALAELVATTPAHYRAHHALMQRLHATILQMDGLDGEALRLSETARASYLQIGETQHAADLSSRIAALHTLLGRRAEAWPIFIDAFRTAGAGASPRALQMVLHSATFVALEEERWDLAHALLNLEVELGPAAPTLYADATVWRVLAAQRAQMQRTALLNIGQARTAVASLSDPRLRRAVENELRLAEAMLAQEREPVRAELLIGEYLAVAEERDLTRVPHVLVMRAALRRRLGREIDAERDLRDAIEHIERRRESVQRDVFRDSFLGRSRDAWTALSDILDHRGDFEAAIETADLPRARIIIDRTAGERASSTLRDISARLPSDRALIAWTIHSDRIVIAAVRRDGVSRFDSAVRAVDLEHSVTRFIAAIRSGEDDAARIEGKRLYGMLVEPAHSALGGVKRLTFVCDPPLDQAPFAALVQPNGRYLIEDFAITIAPGIRAYAAAGPRGRSRATTLVSVGNPRLDPARYSSLPSLEAAGREASEIAAMYSDATLLRGPEATKERVLSLIEDSTVVHVAAHAISDASDPQRSRILFAPDSRGEDALTAEEVAAMNLRHVEMVVLAGCRTAVPGRSYGYVQSLTSAFLAAGAHHVVGSLWDVDDASGRDLSIAFHRALQRGIAPDDAVRQAQLSILKPSRPISAWCQIRLVSVM